MSILDDLPPLVLLTKEEERELILRARAGDQAAKDNLVYTQLRLSVLVMQKNMPWFNRPESREIREDMLTAAVCGIIEAIDDFDFSKDVRFSTYTYYHVLKSLSPESHAQASTSGNVPPAGWTNVRKLNAIIEELYHSLNREPTQLEIEQAWSESESPTIGLVRSQAHALHYPSSLDVPSSGQGGSNRDDLFPTVGETVPDTRVGPEEQAIIKADSDKYKTLIERLTPKEQRVIRMRFGLDTQEEMTLQEIANLMDLSRERIRQIESVALAKLRAWGEE